MLRSLALSDWKSFGHNGGEMHLGRTTLLVGPNASGKSNVLDALRFLQGAAHGLTLYETLRGAWDGGRSTWGGVRGGEAEAARAGSQSFWIAAKWSFDKEPATYVLGVSVSPEPRLTHESLHPANTDRYWFNTGAPTMGGGAGPQPGGAIRVAFRGTGGGRNPTATYPANRSLLAQLEPRKRMAPEVLRFARSARSALRDIVHLDIRPDLMRASSPLHASRLGASGENIASVLHALPEGERQEIVDWLSELCAPQVSAIEFVEVPAVGEVFFFLREGPSTRISARSLSDGTLRFLGILVALLTAPAGSLILLEEPDVGLHPARVHLLAQLLEDLPVRRSIQVLATSHSPVLLAHLSDSALSNVLAFDRDRENGQTVVARVGDLPNYARLRDSKEREHLIATGWLERAV